MLPGALVVARAEASPRQQVPDCWKAGHVAADLGEDRPRRQLADARDGDQEQDQRTKGRLAGLDRGIHLGNHAIDFLINGLDAVLQSVDLVKVKTAAGSGDDRSPGHAGPPATAPSAP